MPVTDLWNALLMVTDIVRFSEQTVAEQIAMVQHLLETLQGDPLSKRGKQKNRFYLHSTGDGFVLAISSDGPGDRLLAFCELARRVVADARKHVDPKGRPMEIRCGLHIGELSNSVADGLQEGFVVGGGLNWCARIADLAGPSQVLVSEEFAQVVRERGFTRPELTFFPELATPCFTAMAKHGRQARFRTVLASGLSDSPPPKLLRAEEIGLHLQAAMEILGESMTNALCGPDETPEAALRRLGPRLTVWVPASNSLEAIRPRVFLPKDEFSSGSAAEPSRTRWSIDVNSDAPPIGPVAAAYVERRPKRMLDLPDARLDREGYVQRWGEWGVSRQVVMQFSRYSRSILVIPLILFERPSGVLCVDLSDPLTGREREVDQLLDTAQLRSSYFIAALLHLRAV